MTRENPTVSSESSAEKTAQKVYQRPKLVIYGNISEITQTADMNGASDGGTGMMNKT